MRVLRSARWILLALLIAIVPASSYAGVFISVGFAPPVLPVYEQPPCPESGLMWTPGYWAYGDDGYYWVPGAWVPAPYEGALWTPGYWGFNENQYGWHEGYWGRHVGYYGGVNYGFGYMGIGFAGGEWRGHEFAYNRAVVRVNTTVIRNTYVNETIVHNTTIINNNRVAYVGGPGGIRHDPTQQERVAMRESHVAPTSFQQQHIQAARTDHTAYFKANNGHPQVAAAARPLPVEHRPAPGMAPSANNQRGNFNGQRTAPNANTNAIGRPAPTARPEFHPGQTAQPQNRPLPQSNPRVEPQSRPASPQQAPRYEPQGRPAPQARPEIQSRPAPQAPRYEQPQNRPAPQARPEPQSRPAPQARPESQARPEPQQRPAQEPRQHEPHL